MAVELKRRDLVVLIFCISVLLLQFAWYQRMSLPISPHIQTNCASIPKIVNPEVDVVCVPGLSYLQEDRAKLNAKLRGTLQHYRPIVTMSDVSLMIETISVFDKAMTAENLTYFIVGGTLIGSYRHHGIVPWDDDIDIIVNKTEIPLIVKALARLEPKYHLYKRRGAKGLPWKFFAMHAGKVRNLGFRWPYIDLFNYEYNNTHLWFEWQKHKRELNVPIATVFPLQRRPYLAMEIPCPCNLGVALKFFGDVDDGCAANTFSHKYEYGIAVQNQAKISCSDLREVYPFVKRRTFNNESEERLMYKNKIVNVFHPPRPCGIY